MEEIRCKCVWEPNRKILIEEANNSYKLSGQKENKYDLKCQVTTVDKCKLEIWLVQILFREFHPLGINK